MTGGLQMMNGVKKCEGPPSVTAESRLAVSHRQWDAGEANYSVVDECGNEGISTHTGRAPTAGVAKAGAGEG